MEIHDIIIETIFYESKTRISDFTRMSHVYGDNGRGLLECGQQCEMQRYYPHKASMSHTVFLRPQVPQHINLLHPETVLGVK